MKTRMSLGLLLVGTVLPWPAPAQIGGSYDLKWSAIDGGGGASTAGGLSVSGTIGQPEAGVMNGGNHTVVGGFWSAFALQTPAAPYLYITKSGGSVTVYWDRPATGYVLDETRTLTPWTPVPFPYQTNAVHIYITEPSPTGNKIYRLRKP